MWVVLSEKRPFTFHFPTFSRAQRALEDWEQVEKDTCFYRDLHRIIAEAAASPSRFVPQHRGLRAPHAVSLHDCLCLRMRHYTHSKITTQCAAYRRSCRTVKRGYPLRAVFRRSSGTLRVPADPDFGQANQGLSHFHDLRGRDFAFMVNNTGIEPATFSSGD